MSTIGNRSIDRRRFVSHAGILSATVARLDRPEVWNVPVLRRVSTALVQERGEFAGAWLCFRISKFWFSHFEFWETNYTG